MFGLGSIGNFLPIIGSIGAGFSGGGLFGLGFTLLSGLLTNLTSPKNPGIENFATHPGFSSAFTNPGFGTMGGGPNAGTFGSMSGYFGGNYTTDYSILPQTPAGQYHSNSCYCYPNQGVNYAPNNGAYGNAGYGQRLSNLQFGGNFSSYLNQYNSVVLPQAPFFPSYQYGQTAATYGSATAPYQQCQQPAMSHYGFGSPRQYNPAGTLYGQQSGSVQVNYGRPNYGGPQDGQPPVVNNHYNIHLHNQNVAQQCETPAPQPECPPPPPVACQPPQPPAVEDCPPDISTATGTKTVDLPAAIVSNNSQAAQNIQTKWGRTPPISTDADWPAASQTVRDRITGGSAEPYSFGGRNIYQSGDGMVPERAAVWHVFQQNETLRFDVGSGNFYETKPDGSTLNKFHISAVANLERQAGSDSGLASRLVGEFLNSRNLAIDGIVRSQPAVTASASAQPAVAATPRFNGNPLAVASAPPAVFNSGQQKGRSFLG